MCTLLFALNTHPKHPFILAANRDEFYKRRTQRLHSWTLNGIQIFGGRDLEAGGTWMGVSRTGRFAAVTNYRDPADIDPMRRSRGELATHYLTGTLPAAEYLALIHTHARMYNGFNLLVGELGTERPEIWWYSNYAAAPQRLTRGIYGLSNALLDTPWPKVTNGKAAFTQLLETSKEPSAFFTLLANRTEAPDDHLPHTGVPLEWERKLSALHIATEHYGTCVSTFIATNPAGSLSMAERAHNANLPKGDTQVLLQV